jgi:hypothetical protein
MGHAIVQAANLQWARLIALHGVGSMRKGELRRATEHYDAATISGVSMQRDVDHPATVARIFRLHSDSKYIDADREWRPVRVDFIA